MIYLFVVVFTILGKPHTSVHDVLTFEACKRAQYEMTTKKLPDHITYESYCFAVPVRYEIKVA